MSNKKTRLFSATWDNVKIPRLDEQFRKEKRNAEGVHFATGLVVLDNGVMFESFGNMMEHLRRYGNAEVTYQDQEEQADAQLATQA